MDHFVSLSDMERKVFSEESTLIFFYTPMCGTCNLARQFINILEKLESPPKIYEADINFFNGETVAKWQIESVPCLAIIKDGNIIDKLYAFESVTKIYEFII